METEAEPDPDAEGTIARVPSGCSVVYLASQRGHTKAVEKLVRSGTDVNAPNKNGRTALMMAAANGHAGSVAALLRGGAAVDAVMPASHQSTRQRTAKPANLTARKHALNEVRVVLFVP